MKVIFEKMHIFDKKVKKLMKLFKKHEVSSSDEDVERVVALAYGWTSLADMSSVYASMSEKGLSETLSKRNDVQLYTAIDEFQHPALLQQVKIAIANHLFSINGQHVAHNVIHDFLNEKNKFQQILSDMKPKEHELHNVPFSHYRRGILINANYAQDCAEIYSNMAVPKALAFGGFFVIDSNVADLIKPAITVLNSNVKLSTFDIDEPGSKNEADLFSISPLLFELDGECAVSHAVSDDIEASAAGLGSFFVADQTPAVTQFTLKLLNNVGDRITSQPSLQQPFINDTYALFDILEVSSVDDIMKDVEVPVFETLLASSIKNYVDTYFISNDQSQSVVLENLLLFHEFVLNLKNYVEKIHELFSSNRTSKTKTINERLSCNELVIISGTPNTNRFNATSRLLSRFLKNSAINAIRQTQNLDKVFVFDSPAIADGTSVIFQQVTALGLNWAVNSRRQVRTTFTGISNDEFNSLLANSFAMLIADLTLDMTQYVSDRYAVEIEQIHREMKDLFLEKIIEDKTKYTQYYLFNPCAIGLLETYQKSYTKPYEKYQAQVSRKAG